MTALAFVLGANQPPERFYRGGARIAGFRGLPSVATHEPEDWVASTTALFGDESLGRSLLPDGVLLADAVAADPVGWLGEEHVARFGADVCLLVKLLDAGQRLPVHAHPDVPFAEAHLGIHHGKTEAWVFLEGGTVYLGFARDVTAEELAEWVRAQDVAAMLGAMHDLDVSAGDAVLVPAGLPHAIGEGAFIVELQEPTDLSILMEWRDFAIDGARDGHLRLGFDTALAAVDRRGWGADEIGGLRGATAETRGALLPDAAEFFRAERVRGGGVLEPGFGVGVVVAGRGLVSFDNGQEFEAARGVTFVAPHAAGSWSVRWHEAGELLRCRPPVATDG